jgi:hypothetical protein
MRAVRSHVAPSLALGRASALVGVHTRVGWLSEYRRAERASEQPRRMLGVKLGRTEDAVRNRASEKGVSLAPTNQRPYGTKKR